MWVARLTLYTVTCNPESARCFDYAAGNRNIRGVGCNPHFSLNGLLRTFNAEPVRMLIITMKSAYLLTFNVSQKRLQNVCCIKLQLVS